MSKVADGNADAWMVDAVLTWHTKDSQCCRVDVETRVPPFILPALACGIVDEASARAAAEKVLKPYDFDYESVSIDLAVKPVMWAQLYIDKRI